MLTKSGILVFKVIYAEQILFYLAQYNRARTLINKTKIELYPQKWLIIPKKLLCTLRHEMQSCIRPISEIFFQPTSCAENFD
jgi:hypothetical protein